MVPRARHRSRPRGSSHQLKQIRSNRGTSPQSLSLLPLRSRRLLHQAHRRKLRVDFRVWQHRSGHGQKPRPRLPRRPKRPLQENPLMRPLLEPLPCSMWLTARREGRFRSPRKGRGQKRRLAAPRPRSSGFGIILSTLVCLRPVTGRGDPGRRELQGSGRGNVQKPCWHRRASAVAQCKRLGAQGVAVV